MSGEHGTPSALAIEIFGIEAIPDADRTATILDFLRLEWGSANSLATAVLGSFPILLGLSFWQGLAATLIGLLLGALILAPMGVFGVINGTNNAVSSSAHFGVVGRIVGSFLSVLTAIAFFSISVWSSGDALIGALVRIIGVTPSDGLFALAYGLFAFAILAVCIFGFRLMLLIGKAAASAVTLLLLLSIPAFAPLFDPGYAGAGLSPGKPGFWPVFVSATLIVLSNPISFGAFLGDWSRYVPRETPLRHVMGATVIAQLLTLLPFLFGLATASIIAMRAPDYMASANYAGGLLAISPGWFLPLLLLLALVSGMSTGTTSLYGTGLDFSSVFPRLSRVQATLVIGSLSIMLIFVGRFAFSLVESITTFVTLILVCTTPWIVVMILGFINRRGYYRPDDLQVFNRGQTGGAYWFCGGWNLPGMGAWIASALCALTLVNIPGQFVGWLGDLADGIDLSIPAALVLPVVLYPALLRLFPEPAEVFGPAGPRLTHSRKGEAAPSRAR